MRTFKGNIFDQPCKHNGTEAICVTTNGVIKANGHAVMGRGIALEANKRYKVSLTLANHLRTNGNVPAILCCDNGVYIISFPTKNDWRDNSDIELIRKSAIYLRNIADTYGLTAVYLTKVGCANGHLRWENVYPVLAEILDDRFIISDY